MKFAACKRWSRLHRWKRGLTIDRVEGIAIQIVSMLRGRNLKADDRKGHGDSDPDRIDVTGGNQTGDDRKGHCDSDPDRIGITERSNS